MTETETIRRSVTIRPDLDARIKDLVATCIRYGVDLDYTNAFNLLAELGGHWLESSDQPDREKYRLTLEKYVDYPKFEESVMDEWFELGEFRKWKLAKNGQKVGPAEYWVNVDRPTRTCTFHSGDCRYVKKSATRLKGLNESLKDGGWFLFQTMPEAEAFCNEEWKNFTLRPHLCRA